MKVKVYCSLFGISTEMKNTNARDLISAGFPKENSFRLIFLERYIIFQASDIISRYLSVAGSKYVTRNKSVNSRRPSCDGYRLNPPLPAPPISAPGDKISILAHAART